MHNVNVSVLDFQGSLKNMNDTEVLKGIRSSRRTHRKSRNGCSNCKRRRVKCDEIKPVCGQCTNHNVQCTFTPGHPRQIADATPLPDNGYVFISSSKTDFELPKRKYQRRQHHPTEETNEQSASLEAPTMPNISECPFSFADLEIFHHYLVVTSITMADDDRAKHILQINLPQLGFRFHYILYLLLAFSSYHMARLPGKGAPSKNTSEGDRHYNTALTQVSSSISALDENTCHAIYGSSVLICLCSLAKGPRPGEYLVFGDSGNGEWLTLLRGIRSITKMSRDVFSIDPVSGANSNTNEALPRAEKEESIPQGNPWPEWKDRLKECERLIETVHPPNSGVHHVVYTQVLNRLANSFENVYGRQEVNRGERCAKVFQWLYQLPEEFVADLQQRQWLALLLLSYFLVILRELDSYWFIQGWPEHVMSEIYRCFDGEQRLLMKWQAEQIEWSPSSD